jgi:protein involved in polysaccharide export with SLBB domain
MKAVERKTVRSLLVTLVSILFLLALTGRAHAAAITTPGTASPAAPAIGGDVGPLPISGGTPDDYVIKVGDSLTIDGNQHSRYLDPRRLYIVGKDGTIKLVFLSRIEVAGLTKRQLEEKLEQLYDPDYFKNLVVTVEVRMQSYEIMGDVKMPGTKEFSRGISVAMAIGRAGGFAEYADQSNVVVLRQDGDRQIVDVRAILRGRTGDDFLVEPGDIIWVQRKGIF